MISSSILVTLRGEEDQHVHIELEHPVCISMMGTWLTTKKPSAGSARRWTRGWHPQTGLEPVTSIYENGRKHAVNFIQHMTIVTFKIMNSFWHNIIQSFIILSAHSIDILLFNTCIMFYVKNTLVHMKVSTCTKYFKYIYYT